MLNRSRREQGVSDYLDVAVWGLLGRNSRAADRQLVSASNLGFGRDAYSYERTVVRRTLPDGRESEAVIERKYWFDAAASGSTPLGKALATTKNIVNRWAKHHPASFPPIVVDLTDGEASDAEPEEIAQLSERIKSVSTLDGQTLLVNIHLSADYDRSTAPIKYPSANEPLPDNRLTRLLYSTRAPCPNSTTPTFRPSKRPIVSRLTALCATTLRPTNWSPCWVSGRQLSTK